METGEAIGTIWGVLRASKLPAPGLYPSQTIKATVARSKKAKKGDVQRWTQKLLQLPKRPTPDHAADALAVAITHAYKTAWARRGAA